MAGSTLAPPATTPTAIKGTAIQQPTASTDNHTRVLGQLKEAVEIGQRLRGSIGDSFVRVSELVNTGVARVVNGTIQPQNTETGSPATVAPGGAPTGSTAVSVSGTYGTGVGIGLAAIPNQSFFGNNSGGSAEPTQMSKQTAASILLYALMSVHSLRLS